MNAKETHVSLGCVGRKSVKMRGASFIILPSMGPVIPGNSCLVWLVTL